MHLVSPQVLSDTAHLLGEALSMQSLWVQAAWLPSKLEPCSAKVINEAPSLLIFNELQPPTSSVTTTSSRLKPSTEVSTEAGEICSDESHMGRGRTLEGTWLGQLG